MNSVKLNFRQKHRSVGKPGNWRSSIRLAPRAAAFLRVLAQDGKRNGAIAVAVEVLHTVLLGTEVEIEKCAEVLAGLLECDETAPRTLRAWALGCQLLGSMLNLQAVEMTPTLVERDS